MAPDEKEKKKTKQEEKEELYLTIKRFENRHRADIHKGTLKKTAKNNYTQHLRKRLNYNGIIAKHHVKFLLQEGLTRQKSLEGDNTSLKPLEGKKLDNTFVPTGWLYCKECSYMCSVYKKNIPMHTEMVCNSDIAIDADTFNESIKNYKNKIKKDSSLYDNWLPEEKEARFVYCLMDNDKDFKAESIELSDVQSIFYIGYGIETRPLQHFEDECLNIRTTLPQKRKTYAKYFKIREVWDAGNPVVIYQMGPSLMFKAMQMEAVLINVLQKRLTNDRIPRLSDFGINWSKEERVDYALHLLHKLLKANRTSMERPQKWFDEPAENSANSSKSTKKTSESTKKTTESLTKASESTKKTTANSAKGLESTKKNSGSPIKMSETPKTTAKSTKKNNTKK